MKPIHLKLIVPLLIFACKWFSSLLPGLLTRFLYWHWFTSPRFPMPVREQHWRDVSKQKVLSLNGKSIHVNSWGKTDAGYVLLLHGWSGRGTQMGAFAQALNSAGMAAVSFDAPGHGLSDGDSTNIYEIAAALNEVVKQYGVPKAIITHSFGGLVAAMAIRLYDLAVPKLVLISCPMDSVYLLDGYQNYLGFDDKVRKLFELRLSQKLSNDFYRETRVEDNLLQHPLSLLIVHDKDDKAVSWKQSEKLLRAIPDSEALFTSGLGHMRILRNHQLIARICEFIAPCA